MFDSSVCLKTNKPRQQMELNLIDYSNISLLDFLMNIDDNDRNTPLKSHEKCSIKSKKSIRLNDDLIERKLFKRNFLHEKSASISIDLRNCLPSITTKTMMMIIIHTTFLDRDEYTSITKQVSYPVNVVYRRVGEMHSNVGMQSGKKNQLMSLSVINLFVHSFSHVNMIVDIRVKFVNHPSKQLHTINERKTLISPMNMIVRHCRESFDRSCSAYTSNNRSRRNSNVDIQWPDCHSVHKCSTDKYHQRIHSNLVCCSHCQKQKAKPSINYRHFPLNWKSHATGEYEHNRYQKKTHRQTKILVDIRKVPCHAKKRNMTDLDSIDEQEDTNNDIHMYLDRRIATSQMDVDDESIFENISKRFSHSLLLSTFELDESVTLLVSENPLQLKRVFERKPACLLSKINDMQRMSINQLANRTLLASKCFFEHQSLLITGLTRVNEDKQNDRNNSDNDLEQNVRHPLSTIDPCNIRVLLPLDQTLLKKKDEIDYSMIENIDQNKMKGNSVKNKGYDDDDSNSNIVVTLGLSEGTLTTTHGIYDQNVILNSSSSDISIDRRSQESLKTIEDDKDQPYSDKNSSIDVLSPTQEDQISANEFANKNNKQVDQLMSQSSSQEATSHSLNKNKTNPSVVIITSNDIVSSIFDISTNESIDIPRCTQLFDSSKQIIDQKSAILFFPNEKTELAQDYKTENMEGQGISDIYEDKDTSARYFTSNQSKTHSFDRKISSSSSSSSISPQRRRVTSSIELDIVENRQHLLDNTDVSEDLSIESDIKQPESIKDKQITEDLELSPIMSISRQTTDNLIETNECISTDKQTKYYVKNLYSDVQADRLSLNSSSPLLRKPTKHKQKSPLVVLRMQSTHRTAFIQPPWASINIAPIRTTRPLKKPFHRNTFSFVQLKDPCQLLQVYTQFQRINCKPYACICTPLQP